MTNLKRLFTRFPGNKEFLLNVDWRIGARTL